MNPFLSSSKRSTGEEGKFSTDEVRLANRNSGFLLELLDSDITPIGAHYLLNHFDVPLLDSTAHQLVFEGAFKNPQSLGLQEIQLLINIAGQPGGALGMQSLVSTLLVAEQQIVRVTNSHWKHRGILLDSPITL